MNKLIIISSILCLTLSTVNAQHNATTRLQQQAPTSIYLNALPIDNNIVTSAQNATNSTQNLVLTNYSESKIGKHYLYQQMHNGVAIYGAYLKVNTNKKGQILNSFSTLIDVAKLNIEQTPVGINSYWVVSDENLLAASAQKQGYNFTLKQADGTVLYQTETRKYYTDTTIKAMVFNPDPLTTAGVTYGQNGTYKNFNDSDYVLLNSQRQWVTLPARFDSGKFILANKYAAITDLKSPNAAPVTSLNDTFEFTRKQLGFKEVMAMYHISQVQAYIQSLGFNDLVNYQLKVDAHSGNADQSFFSYEPDTSLNFGLGGVPDAEDADVIVHEYTHAISHSLNSENTIGTERRAIEESICDVMSCAYSKRLNPFRWRNIFSWDGNNDYWSGRNGASTKTYLNKVGDYYSDSEIWSSAMNNLIEIIGEDEVLKLLFNVIPQLAPNSTMPQAAQLMYDTDSIINNGINRWLLAEEFVARKLGDFYTNTNEYLLENNFIIANTLAFASGTDLASIKLKQTGTFNVQIFDANGRSVLNQNTVDEVRLNPANYNTGIYLAHITYKGKTTYFKLIRY
ncbi:MAG: T9SS type A sorting domain-containing protein [Bacteroidia bacterium]|nr:T9SS type A sorting domain-containing protein [Bacteroidia bacterium]